MKAVFVCTRQALTTQLQNRRKFGFIIASSSSWFAYLARRQSAHYYPDLISGKQSDG